MENSDCILHAMTSIKSIRHQQSKKRNLEEHAFALAKSQDHWMEVSLRARIVERLQLTLDLATASYADEDAFSWSLKRVSTISVRIWSKKLNCSVISIST